MRAIASITSRVKAFAFVLTPMSAVGLILWIASTKSGERAELPCG